MRLLLPAVLATALSSPVLAAPPAPSNFLDLYYVPQAKLTISDSSGSISSDGGTGFGARGRLALQEFFLQGEYQSNKYDGFEGVSFATDFDEYRAGLGASFGQTPFYAMVEYIKQKLDFRDAGVSEDDNGYGIHMGAQGHPGEKTALYAQVGQVDVGDFGKGFEFAIGGAVSVSDQIGIFADYRSTTEKADDGSKGVLDDVRAGLRVSFGG